MRDNCCLFTLGVLLNIGSLSSSLSSPWFIGKIIELIQAQDWDTVNLYALFWFGFTGVGSVFSGLSAYIFGVMQNRVGMQVRKRLYQEILTKDVAFFDARKTGDLLSRLQGDTEAI